MTDRAYLNVDGETLIDCKLFVPNVGVWWAEVIFEGPSELTGAVTLNVGDLELAGTIDPAYSGSFGEQTRATIVGGGNGWGKLLTPQHYHNDAGVRALTVAQDAARLVGEEIGDFDPAAVSVGIDYVRSAGAASRALEDAIGGVAWWVGYDGKTHVGARATSEPLAADYEILDYDAINGLATLAADDLSKVGIGSVLSEGLDAPLTVREFRIEVTLEQARIVVWGGGTASGKGRLGTALVDLVERVTDRRLFGKYRYRVVQMSGNRVELQRVAAVAGLPDVLPVSQKPGVAGAHASLTGGAIVLVEFVEGDRTMPLVVAFAGKDEGGHAPDVLDLSVVTTLRLGGDTATEGVTLGTSHKAWADAHTHGYIPSGTGTPANTTPPIQAGYLGGSGVPDPAPAPSSKVKVL